MLTDSDPFRGARLKVQRAKQHVEELKSLIATICSTQFYEIVANENAGSSTAIIRPLKPMPVAFPLIIGDAVHNLRSSLDHVATACSAAGGGRGKDLFFPFHKELRSIVNDRDKLDSIDKGMPGSKRLICDNIQPSADGTGKELYALHTLDKIDKHNRIIITTTVVLSGNLFITVDGKNYLGAANLKFGAETETPIPIVFPAGELIIKHDYKATLEILFGQPEELQGREVVSTLLKLSERIMEIIESFSALSSATE
jgi:hypothetical protein